MSRKYVLCALLAAALPGGVGATGAEQQPGPGTAPAQNPPPAGVPAPPAQGGQAQGGPAQPPPGQPGQGQPGQGQPGPGGANPFFDTTPAKPAQAEKPRPKWPSLKQRIAKTGGDHIARTYLSQEAAYIGYYEIDGVRVAGFRVPERRQMVYMRIGDRFWNGEVQSITPKQVVVRYREEPDSKPKERQMPRQAYDKGLMNAMGVDDVPAEAVPPPPTAPPAGPTQMPPPGVGMPSPPGVGAPPNVPVSVPGAPPKDAGRKGKKGE